MEKKYTLSQVANWFINKSNENKITLSPSKLQNLIYYAKGFYYVFANESFFDATFVASNSGIKIPELSNKLDSNKPLIALFSNEKTIVDNSNDIIYVTLDYVFYKIASLSDERISEIIKLKNELPSKFNADEKIPETEIASHFREKYLNDEQNNEFGVLRDEIVDIMSFRTYRKYNKAFKVLAKW